MSGNVSLEHDGIPVTASEITKITSGVFKFQDDVPAHASGSTHFSNYSFMFDFRVNENGSITITPNKNKLETGRYELFIDTVHGTASGLIDANLKDSHPPPLRKKVKLPEFTYEIKLPDYEYGQLILLELYPDSENTYSWYINGKEHSSGPGNTSFRAQLEPGRHEISFIARNPAGEVISTWSDSTEVSEK